MTKPRRLSRKDWGFQPHRWKKLSKYSEEIYKSILPLEISEEVGSPIEPKSWETRTRNEIFENADIVRLDAAFTCGSSLIYVTFMAIHLLRVRNRWKLGSKLT